MKLSYRPEIDGLRAIAVLLVVFYHLKIPYFSGGFLGVDIFFVISGYLITSIYFIEKDKNNKFNFLNYFEKRLFRLFPSLIFVILLSLFFGYILLSPTTPVTLSVTRNKSPNPPEAVEAICEAPSKADCV